MRCIHSSAILMAIDAVFMRALDDVRGEPNGLTKNKHKRTLTRFVPPFNELSYNWLGEKWAIKREKSWLTERELLLGKIMAVNCYAAALLLFFCFVVDHVDDVWCLLASFRLSSCRSFVLKSGAWLRHFHRLVLGVYVLRDRENKRRQLRWH